MPQLKGWSIPKGSKQVNLITAGDRKQRFTAVLSVTRKALEVFRGQITTYPESSSVLESSAILVVFVQQIQVFTKT